MDQRNFKFISIILIVLLLYSCAKTIVYLSPYEGNIIDEAKKIIVETKDGETFELSQPKINLQTLTGNTKEFGKKEISVTSIRSVRIEETKKGLATVYSGVGLVLAWLVIGSLTAPEPEGCCPYVYSFDGESYHFDAEPYGAAICEGLKRTDWSELEHLKEFGGKFKVLVANELEETQYIDEMALLVVDHSHDVKIIPDTKGEMHTITKPVTPMKVSNSRNEDITHLFIKKDAITWQSRFDARTVDTNQDLREELVFQFSKPPDATKAKLIVNACTSLWGAKMGKRYLELYGSAITDWYEEVDDHGPAFHRLWSWWIKEELYLMQIKAKTDKGWKALGTLYGSGPFVTHDKAYTLDINEISGDTLTIKLNPPVGFWNIDSVAVDYSEQQPVKVTEIKALRALTNKGEKVRDKLSATDNSYVVLPGIGDSVEMIFQAPPLLENTTRTVILKACGYYKIYLNSDSEEPKTGIIKRIYEEPDYALYLAQEEYIKWKAGKDEN